MMVFTTKSQTLTDIVTTDSTLKKANLFSNALSFFALEFKSANDVIQMKDGESGKVIGKGIVDNRSITIGISCKDGKYKYDIDIEPYKNLIAIPITFTTTGTTSFGKGILKYNGETTGKLEWVSNEIKITNIKFNWDDKHSKYPYNWPPVYHNGNGIPMGMNKAYDNWKLSVDEELLILKKQYSDMSNPNEEKNKLIIYNLITDLKREMSKKSDW